MLFSLFFRRYIILCCDILLRERVYRLCSPPHYFSPLTGATGEGEDWPDFSAPTASFGVAGVAGFGVGVGFFQGNAFDKCPVAPQEQQWGRQPSTTTYKEWPPQVSTSGTSKTSFRSLS